MAVSLVPSPPKRYFGPVLTYVLWALLLLTLLPAGRVVSKSPVWNELRRRPPIAAAGAVLAVGSTWAAATLFPAYPALLPITVAVLLLANVGVWVRARPSFGRRRGLPPGSLGLGASLDAIEQPGFYARAASRWGPVFKMAQFHRPVVCITDLPLGLAVMEEHRSDLAQPRLAFGRLSPGNYIEFMNDEGHARYRAILQSALKGRVIEACRAGVAAAIHGQLRSAAVNDVGRGVDPDRYLTRIGFSAMMRVMCGVPADDSQIDVLYRWFKALGTMRTFTERRPEERVEPYEHLVAWVRTRGTEVLDRIARGEHVEPSVMSEILRSDPAHLDDDTILGNIVLIVHVTHSNVRGLLGWILKESLDHPEYAAELRRVARATPDATRVRALATRFVNETLRLHQSEYFYREVVRSFEFSGFRIPKGWLLRVCVREAHDDPTVFENPGTFDPGRFENRNYNKTEYCPFSDGAHSCFGAGLAVLIAMSFVSTLAMDFDARIVTDGPVVRDGNRHWSHWRPNPGLRVSLVPRV